MSSERNRFYAVVNDGERVLLVDGALPSWQTSGKVRWSDAAAVTAALRDRFGVDAFVLRPLHARRGEDGRGTWAYELEPRGGAARGRWVDASGLGALGEPARTFAAAVLEGAARVDERRAPWSRGGWYDDALSWTDARLAELETTRTGEPAQLHAWAISAVLRIPTAGGDVYFKAVPPLFGQEAAATATLARRHPGRITDVLVADHDRRWMLMADVGGVELTDVDEAAAWERTVDEYARLQIDWLDGVDDLLACGCPDRTLDVLESELDDALGDPLLLELPNGLGPEEAKGLPALAERLRHGCGRLRAYDVPPTLEHGDLHPGNVRVRDGEPVFYDWTDAAVSVPLFTFAAGAPFFDFRGETPDAVRLRRRYAERWEPHLGRGVVEALDAAALVGLFHWATGYRHIAHATEPAQRWELGSVFPWFVRKLLGAEP